MATTADTMTAISIILLFIWVPTVVVLLRTNHRLARTLDAEKADNKTLLEVLRDKNKLIRSLQNQLVNRKTKWKQKSPE